MHASESGGFDVASLLLEAGADKDCRDRWGRTALMHASECGDFEVTSLLLEAGARKDGGDNDSTAAHACIGAWSCGGCSLTSGSWCCNRLLGPYRCMTALMLASRHGYKSDAPSWCRDDSGKTALALASSSGHLEVADLLLQAGADNDCCDNDGKTGLTLVCSHLTVATWS